jgi:DNA-binding FadR family transcriptional regulator
MPTEDFVEKLVEMREIIEPAAVMAAARRRSPEQLVAIGAALDAMEDAPDLDAWAAADLGFHDAVLAATNNELLSSLFSVVETALATYFVMSARTAKNFKYSLPHHRAVYEAIRRRRPNEAAVAMRTMIADSRANMRKGTGKRRA